MIFYFGTFSPVVVSTNLKFPSSYTGIYLPSSASAEHSPVCVCTCPHLFALDADLLELAGLQIDGHHLELQVADRGRVPRANGAWYEYGGIDPVCCLDKLQNNIEISDHMNKPPK